MLVQALLRRLCATKLVSGIGNHPAPKVGAEWLSVALVARRPFWPDPPCLLKSKTVIPVAVFLKLAKRIVATVTFMVEGV